VPEPNNDGKDDRALRILIVTHDMTIGGSQRNAVDLACGVRDLGHDVVVSGPDGPLTEVLRERGVPLRVLDGDLPHRPLVGALPGYRRLLNLTRSISPDLVHSYELTPSLLTFLGAHRIDGTPMTMTINGMSVPDFMPGSVPLQVCSPLIASETRARTGSVGVLEIPTDTRDQYPGYPGGQEFRRSLGIAPDELAVVVVSRFAAALKQEGLETAIRAAGRLAGRHRMRLVLVGDGPAMDDLRALADSVNAVLGRDVVLLTGALVDPRPAYAAADIAFGMAGSLLRAMAFGKPCIVQGEHGYVEMLDPATARAFRWRGFYGIGAGGTGEDRLVDLLDRLLGDPAMRREKATFALDLVRRHYGLDHAVEQQIAWYRRVLAEHVATDAREVARTVALVGAWFAGRALRRPQGKAKTEFFNSTEHIAPGIRGPVPATFDPDLPDVRVPGEGPVSRRRRGERCHEQGASDSTGLKL
jgi:hypothetical protein